MADHQTSGSGASVIERHLTAQTAIWFIWTLGLTIFFVSVAATNLDNFRPVSSDDAWIMSASYKLATEGVFGSDMYAGFFNADQHYFIALPVHHILQAASFRLSGAGVAQARWVSLAGAVVLIWAVSWLAYRWYGLGVAVLAGVFLIVWRSDLIATWPGLPLLTVARSGRYDVGGVAWIWLSILCLDRTLRRPHRFTALTAGLCAGLATLTQFFGVFVLPLTGIAWLWNRGRRALTESYPYWMVGGVLLIVLPYLLYTMRYPEDMAGQVAFTKGGRFQFDRPEFYLDNARRELNRFTPLFRRPAPTLMALDKLDRPFSPWLLTISVCPAFAYLSYRVRQQGAVGDRLLWLSLVVLGGSLALLEQTKAPLYAIVLLPSICITLAMFAGAALHWAWQGRQLLPLRLVAGGMILVLLSIVMVEGERAYRVDLGQADEVSDYLEVGELIDTNLTPGAPVLGADRWWWALHDHPYLAFNNLRIQWLVAEQKGGRLVELRDLMEDYRIEFVVVSKDVLGALSQSPVELQSQFWSILQQRGARLAKWTDPTYHEIEVYRINLAPD